MLLLITRAAEFEDNVVDVQRERWITNQRQTQVVTLFVTVPSLIERHDAFTSHDVVIRTLTEAEPQWLQAYMESGSVPSLYASRSNCMAVREHPPMAGLGSERRHLVGPKNISANYERFKGAETVISLLDQAGTKIFATQLAVWDVPISEEFFRAVRQVNEKLTKDRQLRVVLAGPQSTGPPSRPGPIISSGSPCVTLSRPI